MGSLRLLFVLVAVPLLVVAQAMIFDSPALDETVNGGRTYVVNMHTSLDDVSLSQLNNFELLLLSGKYGSSANIYSWNLENTNPATTQSSIVIPPSVAPNAVHAYFMGIRGSMKSNSSISATYFSDYFTLANMTGNANEQEAKSKAADSPSLTNKFPMWAFVVILGTAVLSLSLSWGILCYRLKRKGARGGSKNADCEEAPISEKWYGVPIPDPKNGRIIKNSRGRSSSSPITPRLPTLTGGPQRPPRPPRPLSTTLSGNAMFELDASEIQRPPNVWRNSWQTVRGLVVGGRTEVRTSRIEGVPILPKVPIPRGATIGRRNEVRRKYSYPDT